MTHVMIYADNGDVVGTYDTRDAAVHKLAAFVGEHPELQDEIGLRPYENGRPAGPFMSAAEILHDRLAQQHLV